MSEWVLWALRRTYQYFSHTMEATYRKQESCTTRSIILIQTNQSLHFPLKVTTLSF